MKERIAPAGTRFDFWTPPGNEPNFVILGEDDVIAVLLDEDGEPYEWFEVDTYFETVQNFATQAPEMVILEGAEDSDTIRIARHERALYADCFGLELEVSA